ncbi:E3 ubiquitin-protein ligase TRIM71-like [Anneissia japonica]|uniref:E3 ubiquitin-protein ligase TRIM71-like n=1 Tax=Anneissia japonica TaxID=1529436 RepID=UPI0014256753|nr:E3 ubiquitin-protein ligase TRIM71-like [Anneissia japonica]
MAEHRLNQFLDDLDQKILECMICFRRLQEPKSLNCLHSFCKACLQDWINAKGTLSCPTCLKSYPIPEGGLQNLPPNTFLNNLLEIVEQVENGEHECICGKGEKTKYYCQDCREYLCPSCRDYHVKFRGFTNHQLHLKQDILQMSPQQLAALHPPLCSQHNERLKFFCKGCNIPICMHCAITEHNVADGNHKPVDISELFNEFREISDKLKKDASVYKDNIQDGLTKVLQNASNLDKSKDTCSRDIENCVKAIIKRSKDKEKELKNEMEKIYEEKKKVTETQTHELRAIISDVNTKLNLLDQLLKSDEAMAMESSVKVTKALKERINELPKLEPIDDGEIHFIGNKPNIKLLQKNEIGIVAAAPR